MNLVKLSIIGMAVFTAFSSSYALAQTSSTSQRPLIQPPIAAPFTDMVAYPTPSIDTLGIQNGLNQITLGFVTSSSTSSNGKTTPVCSPVWGGQSTLPIENPLDAKHGNATSLYIKRSIEAYQKHGGDVLISFGGAEGSLAPACNSIADMQNALDTVVKTYGVRHLDFDIEQSYDEVNDPANHIDLRSQAIAALQQAALAQHEPPIDITLTLPTNPDGLDANGLGVLDSAIKYGVVLSRVNGMTMDYGSTYDSSDMAKNAETAAAAIQAQIIATYQKYQITVTPADAAAMVGVTPMIGVNDNGSVYTVADANKVMAYAQSNGLGEMSFWSLNRDLINCNSKGLYACSESPDQTANYQYTDIVAPYGTSINGGPGVTKDPNYQSLVPPVNGCADNASKDGERWSSALIYNPSAGSATKVTYLGSHYTAKYWTCGDAPTNSSAWALDPNQPPPKVLPWNPKTSYDGGAQVTYNPDGKLKGGDTYRANWNNKDVEPDKNDGVNGVWTDVTVHYGPGGVPLYNPVLTYPTKGTEVSYQNLDWVNQWYVNPGEYPGKNYGQWLQVTQK